jgi:large conductance mechanosensitive channel
MEEPVMSTVAPGTTSAARSTACAARGLAAEFKAFILRGNVVDLAVGIVIGLALAAVVTALVRDIITPIIAAFGGTPNFSSIYFTIHNSKFLVGDFINAVVAFVIIAAVVFFFVVKPVNGLMARRRTELITRDCPYCLSSVPIKATRCAFCTSDLSATAPGAGAM